MSNILSYIDFNSPKLHMLIVHIMLNTFVWNFIGRIEYKTKCISKLLGTPLRGVYASLVVIFSLCLSRNFLFKRVVDEQQKVDLPSSYIDFIGYLIYGMGTVFVVTSTYQLGIVGTYLGDYFGILLPNKVTGFPFNVTSSPMYDGSVLNHLGHSILHRSPVGFLITIWIWIIYRVGCYFEE